MIPGVVITIENELTQQCKPCVVMAHAWKWAGAAMQAWRGDGSRLDMSLTSIAVRVKARLQQAIIGACGSATPCL